MTMQNRRRYRFPATALVSLSMVLVASPAAGQRDVAERSAIAPQAPWLLRAGVGYAANAPHQLLGFGGYALSSRLGGIGLYLDAKFDLDSPRDDRTFIGGLTAQMAEDSLGDAFFSAEESWASFSAALVRPLTRDLMLYAGAGYGKRETYNKYRDPSGSRGVSGFYTVEDEEADGGGARFLGGAFFRILSSIHLQFGVETGPNGMTVGASYELPFGR